MILRNNQPFINANKKLSKQHQHWLVLLQKYINNHPDDYSSSLTDLMSICGFSVDMESVRLYQSFHNLLVKQRKNTDKMFRILIDDGWFNKYISEGANEKQIYGKFIETCLSWGIIPLYYDVDGLYKIVDLDSFMIIKTERLRSTCKEISTKMNILKDTSLVLPKTVGSGMDQLVGSDQVKPMIDARNELNRLLPDRKEEDD